MSTPDDKPRSTRRTSLITAGAIAGVVIAGAVAVGTNIGILNAADDSEIGSLSAAGDLVPANTQVVDVYLDEPTSTATIAPDDRASGDQGSVDAQLFTVDAAGTVAVIPTAGGIRLGDVLANALWTWRLAQTDESMLAVSFTDGARTLEFTASVGPDGAITAAVAEPIASAASTAPAATDDDQHDDDGDEHDDEHDDDEHEGRGDDD